MLRIKLWQKWHVGWAIVCFINIKNTWWTCWTFFLHKNYNINQNHSKSFYCFCHSRNSSLWYESPSRRMYAGFKFTVAIYKDVGLLESEFYWKFQNQLMNLKALKLKLKQRAMRQAVFLTWICFSGRWGRKIHFYKDLLL